MAGDWIKMRCDLRTHPKVVRIASALKADTLRVVGGLHAVWSLFDAHSEDGKLPGYNAEAMDVAIGWAGFTGAMIAVGWASVEGEETLVVPRFDEHNGKSAKRRATETERKRNARKAEDCPDDDRDTSANDADKKRSREEKRREEEKNNPPTPPTGGKRGRRASQKTTMAEFLAECEAGGIDAIPDTDPVFGYADTIGLQPDFLELAWAVFAAKAAAAGKQQKNWRQTFRNYVENNYLKLWYQGEGGWQLTTAGKQAKLAYGRKDAA